MGLLSGLGKVVSKGLGWFGGPGGAALGTALETFGGIKAATGRANGPRSQSYQSLMGAAKAADDLGLHRLTVAGSPAGYSPAPMSAAEGLMSAGQALRNRPSAKENELLEAQIEEARSRTALNNANARRAFLGPQPGLGGFSPRLGDMVSAHRDRLGGPRGVRVEPEADVPLTGTANLGNTAMVSPNEEAFSVGIDELLAGLLVYGPQWLTAQTRRLGQSARAGATEPKSREAARRRASEANRRANNSPYLGVRRQ